MIPKYFFKKIKDKPSLQKYANMIKKPNDLSFKLLSFKHKDLLNKLSASSLIVPSQLKDKLLNSQIEKNFFKISLFYRSTPFNDQVINKCLEDKKFLPTLFLVHPFFQSIYNVLGGESYKINFSREYVQMKDGGQISLDWAFPSNPIEKKILFIIHGLTGGSEMPYVQSLVTESIEQGFTTVVFHNRGVNGTLLTTPEPFSGVKLEDIDSTIQHIKKSNINVDLYGVGLSLGGNLLLRYAASKQKNVEFKGLVAIATPFNINICLKNLKFIYEKFFLKRYIHQTLIPNLEVLKILEKTHNINFDQVLKAKNLKEFHEMFTVKAFGFKNVEEYFDSAKINEEHIKKISVPTLLLHSKDDPITTIKCVPFKEIMKNQNIIYIETENGGHICWFNKNKPKRVNIF